jgi:hypothetical protein
LILLPRGASLRSRKGEQKWEAIQVFSRAFC